MADRCIALRVQIPAAACGNSAEPLPRSSNIALNEATLGGPHRRAVLLCLTVLLSGCTPFIYDAGPDPSLVQVKAKIDARFQYVDQQNRYTPGATGDQYFRGNCVNYSDAALYQLKKLGLPAEQWFVMTETHQPHMVTCSQGWCVDNRARLVTRRENLDYRWVEMVR